MRWIIMPCREVGAWASHERAQTIESGVRVLTPYSHTLHVGSSASTVREIGQHSLRRKKTIRMLHKQE
jgi:hypothetical protein